MHENQVYKDKHQVDGGVSIPLPDLRSCQMTLDAQHGKQFPDPQVQVGQREFEHRFDLSLKKCKFSIIHKEAPSVWFFTSELVHLNYHSLGAFSIKFYGSLN